MSRINEDDLEWEEQVSPKRKFGILRKNLSQGVGGKKDTGSWGGGHPFDLEKVRLPPGMTNWPLHAHAAQWEAYIILSGTGRVRHGNITEEIRPGDFLVYPPGEAHQFINDGDVDLVYYVVADNPRADVIHYPDSDKFFVKPQRKAFRDEVGYFDHEE